MRGLIFCIGTWVIVGMFVIVGCATLQPGADPLVVHTEQVETLASASFDFVVSFDDSNRGFWKTNAPAFHNFAEWLRQPITTGGTNVEPRGLYMLNEVDSAKVTYQANKSSSNVLISVLGDLEAAQQQASAWSVIVKGK